MTMTTETLIARLREIRDKAERATKPISQPPDEPELELQMIRDITRHEHDRDTLTEAIRRLKAMEAVERERDQLKAENDSAWFDIEHGWSIEPRSYFEALNHGFPCALGHALHHIWKRDPQVVQLEAQVADLTARLGIKET